MTWVFCAGMIRSGSTVQFQITSAIVEATNRGKRFPYTPEANFAKLHREAHGHEFAVFKAHLCLPDLAYECLLNGAKVVYSYRDIRDVAASAIRKFAITFDELIKKGWLDQAIDDYYQWTAMPDVLISRYETFHNNLTQETQRISSFLQIPLGDQVMEHIGRDHQLDRQKAKIAQLHSTNIDAVERGDLVFDPRELLHWNHIHEGQVASWKISLTQEQSIYLTDRFSDWLLATGYLGSYEECNRQQGPFEAYETRAARLMKHLVQERQNIVRLRQWAEKAEERVVQEQENARQMREWAEQTENFLATEKKNSEGLRAWAESAEGKLATEREGATALREQMVFLEARVKQYEDMTFLSRLKKLVRYFVGRHRNS